MTDPDLRRWLSRQTRLPVGHLPLAVLRGGGAASVLQALQSEGPQLVVADAVSDDDLLILARAVRGARLVTGGSGIAMGLPANFGIRPSVAPPFDGQAGPGLVLSGSCSGATLAQVARYGQSHPSLALDDRVLTEPAVAREAALAFIDRHRDACPLIHSGAGSAEVAARQARLGRDRIAHAFESFFAAIARAAIARGWSRILVAGGETSGAVAGGLGPVQFLIGPEIDKGIPALRVLGGAPLVMALKSGNFGAEDVMARAMAVLGGRP